MSTSYSPENNSQDQNYSEKKFPTKSFEYWTFNRSQYRFYLMTLNYPKTDSETYIVFVAKKSPDTLQSLLPLSNRRSLSFD
jgi:hypothetical protein